MPQPASIQALTEELLGFYQAAWDRISALEQATVDDWARLRRAERLARLRELRATVEALMGQADEQALRYATGQLPQAYQAGAAAGVIGAGAATFAQVDVDAVNGLAADTYDNLLQSTRFVRRSTKALIRTLAREHVADKLLRGLTAVQVGKDLAVELEQQRIAAVVYKDGSRHGLADYADMLVRTQTATAYSRGTLNQLDHAGIRWVEVFDGAGCGWTSHADPDKANGTVRSLADCQEFPLSHPRCQRAFGGRPDVSGAREAKQAQPSTTAAQRADQAAAEVARAGAVAAAAGRRSLEAQVTRRADALLSDAANRVRSPAYARAVVRREARARRLARQG